MPYRFALRNGKRFSFQYSFSFIHSVIHSVKRSPSSSICKSHFLEFNCWFQLEKPTEVIASRGSIRPPFNPHHPLKWLLTVIKRNCNNMDLISTGNKHRWSTQQIIKGRWKIDLVFGCASTVFFIKRKCKQSSNWQKKISVGIMIYFAPLSPWFFGNTIYGQRLYCLFVERTLFVCWMRKNSKHSSRSACSTIIMNNEKGILTTNSTLFMLGLLRVITHRMMNMSECICCH